MPERASRFAIAKHKRTHFAARLLWRGKQTRAWTQISRARGQSVARCRTNACLLTRAWSSAPRMSSPRGCVAVVLDAVRAGVACENAVFLFGRCRRLDACTRGRTRRRARTERGSRAGVDCRFIACICASKRRRAAPGVGALRPRRVAFESNEERLLLQPLQRHGFERARQLQPGADKRLLADGAATLLAHANLNDEAAQVLHDRLAFADCPLVPLLGSDTE